MTLERLEHVAPLSRVKHSTTEPLRSPFILFTDVCMYTVNRLAKVLVHIFVLCLFDLIFLRPFDNLSVIKGQVFLG